MFAARFFYSVFTTYIEFNLPIAFEMSPRNNIAR